MDVTYTPQPVDREASMYVAGHGGLVGSAVWRALTAAGFTHLVGRTSSELDLRDRDRVVAADLDAVLVVDPDVLADPRPRSR